MDKVLEKAQELSNEIQKSPEVVEYLRLKELIENDSSLNDMKKNIARLTQENKIEERDNLIKLYNANPLVNNFNIMKEKVLEILKTVQTILK